MRDGKWAARAAAWELSALSFRYPEPALVEAVASGQWAEAAAELAAALGGDVPDDVEGMDAASSADAFEHELRVEATRLFVGSPRPACSPYEGIRRAQAEGASPLLFVSKHAMEVERFCRECGLKQPEGTNEPFDHVATECELLEFLAVCASGTQGEGGEAARETSGRAPADVLAPDEAARRYDAFMAEHALTWMPRFCDDVRGEARHPFYRAAADFLAMVVVQAAR